MSSLTITRPKRRATVVLWTAQIVLAAFYAAVGVTKLSQPFPALVAMMHWPAVLPEWAVRCIGAAELAGAIGLVLPAATKIVPGLTILAAAGLVTLQLSAIVFHVSRGEFQVLPLNAVLLAVSAFILWGRSRKPGS